MQRSQRNVPVYLREARRAEEAEQEALLLLKSQQEEELYLQGEQVGADRQYQGKKQKYMHVYVCVYVCVCVCVCDLCVVCLPR